MSPAGQPPRPTQSPGRLPAILIGTLFAGCAVAIFLVVPSANLAGYLCGVVLLLLGLQSIVAGVRGRSSWLSKIGPLP